jgi:FKBP-type peptidyl-prolyl cis-trans isomerase 2
MTLNEKKTVKITKDEAYGDPSEDLIIEVPAVNCHQISPIEVEWD